MKWNVLQYFSGFFFLSDFREKARIMKQQKEKEKTQMLQISFMRAESTKHIVYHLIVTTLDWLTFQS